MKHCLLHDMTDDSGTLSNWSLLQVLHKIKSIFLHQEGKAHEAPALAEGLLLGVIFLSQWCSNKEPMIQK